MANDSELKENELNNLQMKKFLIPLLTLPSLLLAHGESALANPFTQKLGSCMINSSSIKEKQTLNKWTLRLQSEHPELKDLINMSEEEKLKLDKEVGGIYTDLLIVKCKEEAKKAITYEGWDKMVGAFAIFGNASSRVITNHPNVRKVSNGFSRYVDMTKLGL